jgi:hypothetical protein
MKQKIDTSRIEGYAGMSAEDKLKALEAYEVEVPEDKTEEMRKLKDSFDRVSSELAKKNKEERDKLSEDEKAKAELNELIEKLQKRNDELEKESKMSKYVARYIGLGYSEDLAKSTAEAHIKGDMDTVFKNAEAHNKALEAKFKKELLAGTGKPDDKGAPQGAVTKETLSKMSQKERFEYSKSHPEDYAKLYGGK